MKKLIHQQFQECQLSKNYNDYDKFLIIIENTVDMAKKLGSDEALCNEIVETLVLQKSDPEMRKNEWSSARNRIGQIVNNYVEQG